MADAFRNYKSGECSVKLEEALIDKAQQLNLTVPEMTVLIGGLRTLGIVYDDESGILTQNPGVLSNDFFVNLLDRDLEWIADDQEERFVAVERGSSDRLYQATRADLIFASNSELKAQTQFYAQDDNREKFVKDFVKAWVKVMQNDRFDLK